MAGLFVNIALIGVPIAVVGSLWVIGWYHQPDRVQRRQQRRSVRRSHA